MEDTADKPPFAWQPLTFGGVARFARATRSRLFLVQLLVALLSAGTVVWFLHSAWVPIITDAVNELPAQGEIRAGRLSWLGNDPAHLADNHFLAIAVDLRHSGAIRSPSHLQVELGLSDVELFSLFGYVSLPYPPSPISLNRVWMEPWWGAWAPAILAIVFGTVVLGLLLAWALLATLYFLPAWLLGYFANRDLPPRGCWTLAGAALMPGAFVMCGTVVLYGLGSVELIGLMVGAVLHLVIGWVYVAAGVLSVRRLPGLPSPKSNPFHGRAANPPPKSADPK